MFITITGVAVAYFKSKEDLDASLQKHGEIHGTVVTICPYENDLFINTSKTEDTKPVWDSIPVKQLRNEIKEVFNASALSFLSTRLVVFSFAISVTTAPRLNFSISFLLMEQSVRFTLVMTQSSNAAEDLRSSHTYFQKKR